MPVIKCAVYVRKSTEHGLEQAFNSLDNQEQSCKAYISSQAFNNWEYTKTYSDGVISGGTMERPGLQEMLSDIAKGIINTVVVYKVDRLSRSILDFHNMMKYFDKYNCNFVSITQAFDTSTSMGKLTLNMLLSFAQFEREVASERVRDKIRASKAKGLWMGGNPPLGYDIKDKKLVVNEMEAQQVKQLFEKYLELQSFVDTATYARRIGITTKHWHTTKNKPMGGRPLKPYNLHLILTNKIYIGLITHKKLGTAVRGEHSPIISEELFNQVQEIIKSRKNTREKTSPSPNIFSSKVFSASGERFYNQRSNQNLFYYAIKGFYLPAVKLDKIGIDTICNFLNSDMKNLPTQNVNALKSINFCDMDYTHKKEFIGAFVTRIIYTKNQLTFYLNTNPDDLAGFMSAEYINQNMTKPVDYIVSGNQVIITVPVILRPFANTRFNKGNDTILTVSENKNLIVKAFATAWRYREMYEECGDVDTVARNEHVALRYVYKHLALAYINPTIANNLISGKINLPVRDILDKVSKTYNFNEQEKLFCIPF
jgi:DNA invertase Pin-like site-specific DNA recombinase